MTEQIGAARPSRWQDLLGRSRQNQHIKGAWILQDRFTLITSKLPSASARSEALTPGRIWETFYISVIKGEVILCEDLEDWHRSSEESLEKFSDGSTTISKVSKYSNSFWQYSILHLTKPSV